MSLAELVVVDVDADASSPSLSVFVLCNRSTAQRSSDALHIQLLDPPGLYEADVASRHKPRALDCSGSSFVQSVETALGQSESRFEFRWSRQKRTLTLMERSEFAMKFCAIEFVESQSGDKWCKLLHQVATRQKEDNAIIVKRSSKVTQLGILLEQKEKLLESALDAKQKTEDKLVDGFCKVLNAKKDEIRKLQYEVDKAQELQKYEVKPATKRKMSSKKREKGAMLKREVEEEDEEMSDGSTKEESEATASEEDEENNGTQLKRAKRDAVKAYSQLPANLRTSSVQISSAEDLLSDMDDIIKNEEEVDAAIVRGTARSQGVRSKSSQPSSDGVSKSPKTSRTKSAAGIKTEPAVPPKIEPTKPIQPTKPQVDEPMDSEEEDILDMLS
ncbi:hypothetical protein P3T76_003161 [Phytophthora citrophthora]|uniref:DNA repair protein XRCC4 n=1 Tax=Phytophthora citrophthora TaxID=4793 RepID=A0AAD9GXZ5_9STRA|nr:hypothetical protein P3T76_003161 [Phytophthora citrophthora]